MNHEEIKPNQMYNLSLYFTRIDKDGDYVFSALPSEPDAYYLSADDVEKLVSPINPYTPLNFPTTTRIPEPAPKYDPCRKFRKGDKVRLVPFHGRCPIMYGENVFGIEEILTVEENENKEYEVLVNGSSARQMFHSCFLELVTPVEDLEPYSVHETDYLYRVMQSVACGEQVVCESRKNTHPHAKEAAEAERARLNEEWRKEHQK